MRYKLLFLTVTMASSVFASSALAATVSPPTISVSAATKAAAIKVTTPKLTPLPAAVKTFGKVSPPFINNLVAARLTGLTLAQGELQKKRSAVAFLKALTRPRSTLAVNPHRAVAFTNASVPVISSTTFANGVIRFSATPDWQVDQSTGHATLGAGEVLVTASRDMMIDASTAQISVKKGATVLLYKDPCLLRVVNINDKHRDAVMVTTADKSTALGAGHECSIGDCTDTLVQYNRNHPCGRRFCKDTSTDKVKMQVSEISLPSLLQAHELMRSLYKSNDPKDSALSKDILKTAACLVYTRARTPFQWEEF